MDPGLQPLRETDYKGDLDLLDRYVGFSSELVRISLLGLAAIGFYLKEFVAPGKGPEVIPGQPMIAAAWFNLLLGFAGFLLAVAVACGLLHRYYATDGLASHLRALRLSADPDRASEVETEVRRRTNRYRLSRGWLVSSECAVAAGVGFLGVAFGVRFGIIGDTPGWKIAVPSAIALVLLAAIIASVSWWRTLRRKAKLN